MPDFQAPIQEKGVVVLMPYAASGAYTLLPQALDIARRQDGAGDFHLGIVRPENPMLPPSPYGMLDFRLQAVFAMQDGLAIVRAKQPGAMLEQAVFRGGFVQISPMGELKEASQLCAPVRINFQGLGLARFFSRLDLESALLVKGMLTADSVPLRATAHLELWGVAPRLPLQVRFDPAQFLRFLLIKAGQGGGISRAELAAALAVTSGDLPWRVEGKMDGVDPTLFGDCMADHVRARFASFGLAPQTGGGPILVLPAAEQFGSGTFLWDLAEPAATARTVTLTFDPLASARALVAAHGIEAVVSTDTVRRLQTGFVSLSVAANLPAQRQGILSLGVTVKVPPKLPFRPQQINRTVELQGPSDSGFMLLQLAPAEKLAYSYKTFVILQDSAGTHRLEGEDTAHEGDKLDLDTDDFPLTFIPVEASDRLLAAGALTCTQRYDAVQNTFSLTPSQPRLTLAVPRGSSATLEFEVRSADRAHVLKLGPMPARPIHLDLSSFREYGPQTLDIRCTFDAGARLLAVDLLPESSPESPENISVVALTPESPQRQWKWFAPSPFAPGYHYRIHKADASANPWSNVRSPFEPLLLEAAAASQTVGAGA